MRVSWMKAVLAGAVLSISMLAQAADSLPPAPFAALTFLNPSVVVIDRADVDIQGRAVSVQVQITNPGKTLAKTALQFALPAFEWGGGADDYFDKNFPELEITFQGKRITPRRTVQALVGPRDVTLALKKAGLDPLVVAQDQLPADFASNLKDNSIKNLVQTGVLLQRDGVLLPAWQVKVSYIWPGVFAPNSTTTVGYSYHARPGFANGRADALKPLLSRYCTDFTDADLPRLSGNAEFFNPEEYVIPLTAPAPAQVHLNYVAQAVNTSWALLQASACPEGNSKVTRTAQGLSLDLPQAGAARFAAIFYQKR